MLKSFILWISRFKYGLLIFFLLVAFSAFLLGSWWSGQKEPVSHRMPALTREEQAWQEEGLLLGDGLYFVGSEIKPGVYRTTGADTSLYGCRWQRLSGFGAENKNVIVNYVEDKGLPTMVIISASDKGFKTQGCGYWYAESLPVTESPIAFGDGAFLVGRDIRPGTYKSEAARGCYWERLSGLSRNFYSGRLYGADSELIASSNNTIVTIEPTDKGFISSGCLQWTRQAD